MIPSDKYVAYNAAFYFLDNASFIDQIRYDRMVLAGIYQSPEKYTFVATTCNYAEKEVILSIPGNMSGAKLYDIFGRERATLSGSYNEIELNKSEPSGTSLNVPP